MNYTSYPYKDYYRCVIPVFDVKTTIMAMFYVKMSRSHDVTLLKKKRHISQTSCAFFTHTKITDLSQVD